MASFDNILSEVKEKNITTLFTDYYDTIVHRKVHPNQALRIWSKLIITELGLNTTIENLYFTRISSSEYLAKKYGLDDVELSYEVLKNEIALRLINSNLLPPSKRDSFLRIFELADLKSEQMVQYLNPNTLEFLKTLKSQGIKIVLISDFYGPKSLFENLLEHHGIKHLFEDIYTSSQLGKSKHRGNIYLDILNRLGLEPHKTMMVGDNKRSDFLKAKEAGMSAYRLPHKKYLLKNKINNLGSDKTNLNNAIESIRKKTREEQYMPFTEYIIFYHVFIMRLFENCSKEGIKNLFFLSREGQFLKKLFDSYQDSILLSKDNAIKTHYLKISRQASLQISFKPLEEENFNYLKKNYQDLSVSRFLDTFNCTENFKMDIAQELQLDIDKTIQDFFNSQAFELLKGNSKFQIFYDTNRTSNKEVFNNYVNSLLDGNTHDEMVLVDVGWGGTMQESIYEFYKKEKAISGYYLGLKEIYTIEEKTKRSGLLFSILPYATYSDHILMANTQLYEQFSAASHGCVLGYSEEAKDFTIEVHKAEEKWLYDNYIKLHQEQMFTIHQELLKTMAPICYSDQMLNDALNDFALKTGLLQNHRKLAFLQTLSSGFYQNIGENKVGISYQPTKLGSPIKYTIGFLLRPERFFRYLVKIKPTLYSKNKVLAYLFPSYLIYVYFKFNKWVRFKILKSHFLLKFNYFQ
ncbi:HAD family hydrolase [Confluentibacter citreus]|uniref:HAD family hydrolase n=1 Tax=Confluentibacter citreus TaxID=2007307 RepID=UPI000C28CA0E|nr:HAD family hydrolase [Confluentibacter citreus]